MAQIILANPPYVIHPETGIFKGLDQLCAYAVNKDNLYKQSGGGTACLLYPQEFGIQRGVRAGSRWPHLSGLIHTRYAPFPFLLAYASSYLKAHGVDALAMDCVSNRQFSYEKFIDDLTLARPEIVLVETSQATEEIDLWLCGRIARFSEVALAGPHIVDETINRLREKNPHIRYFLKGEYIVSALEMAQSRRPGIYESKIVTDLDAIPFPDRSFPGADRDYDPIFPHAEYPQLQIWGSKGCPFHCSFCLWTQTVTIGTVSLRSPEKIMEEIEEAVALHGYRHISFDDDTFNIGNERIAKLCGYLKKLGLPWAIMARADTSPLELFDCMVESGCRGIKFGVESFDIDVIARINKQLDRETLLGVIRRLGAKYPELRLHLMMMKNLPGQTEEIHKKDMKILSDLGYSFILHAPNSYRTYQLSPYIGYSGTLATPNRAS